MQVEGREILFLRKELFREERLVNYTKGCWEEEQAEDRKESIVSDDMEYSDDLTNRIFGRAMGAEATLQWDTGVNKKCR